MSVLKSTNSGRSNIRLELKYLREHGWHYRCPCDTAVIVYDKIWRDDQHFLNLMELSFGNGESHMIYYYEEIGDWVYNFTLRFLSDLDDLEEFWKNKDIDFDKAEEKLVKDHPGIKTVNIIKLQTQIMTDEITSSIDKRIVDRINTSYDYKFVKDRASRIAARII